MNDSDLNRVLKSAEPPKRSEDYWEGFPGRVSRQLNRPQPSERPAARWQPRLAWGVGFAIVCVVAGFLAGNHFGRRETADGNSQLLQSEKLIREVMAMFPNRVRAIVKDESGLRIVLSDDADVPISRPLWVKVNQGALSTTLVTFSGQELRIAGQKMTVLEEADGGVILVGDRFAWSSNGPKGNTQDLRIQARPLQIALR